MCTCSGHVGRSGYPYRAAEGVTRALALAHEMSHVQSIVSAAYYAAHIHLLGGDRIRRCGRRRSLCLAEEHGLELWATVPDFIRPGLLLQAGRSRRDSRIAA